MRDISDSVDEHIVEPSTNTRVPGPVDGSGQEGDLFVRRSLRVAVAADPRSQFPPPLFVCQTCLRQEASDSLNK
jgi:hypothetical protein